MTGSLGVESSHENSWDRSFIKRSTISQPWHFSMQSGRQDARPWIVLTTRLQFPNKTNTSLSAERLLFTHPKSRQHMMALALLIRWRRFLSLSYRVQPRPLVSAISYSTECRRDSNNRALNGRPRKIGFLISLKALGGKGANQRA